MSSTAAAGVQTALYTGIAGGANRFGAAVETWLLAERHQLFLWIPVCLGVGVGAYFALPAGGQRWAAGCFALGLALAGASRRGQTGRCLIWLGLLVAAGLAIAAARTASTAAPRLDREMFAAPIVGRVVDVKDLPGREQHRILLRVEVAGSTLLTRVSVRGAAGPDLRPGALVSLRATLRPPPGPSLPGGYDFSRRAWFQGIGATGYALGAVTILRPADPPSGIMARLDALRRTLTARLTTAVGGAPGAIAAALVTGDQGGIDEDVAQDMRDSGLAHLLSISGLHIAIVVGGTMSTVRRLLCLSGWIALRWPVKIIAALLAALAGIAYTLLAGAEVPTVRSCIAAVIVLIGIMLGREAISLRLVAVAALLVLLFRPEALLGASFQLSFAAVTALVALYQSDFGRRRLAPPAEAGVAARALHALFALVVTGILVELTLAPTALFHFNRTGLYGMVANVMAIPLTSFVIMPALIAALLLDMLGLAAPAFWLLGVSLQQLIALAAAVADWPGAVVRMPIMPEAAYGCFIVGGLWFCLWRERPRLLGLPLVALGMLLTLTARPPDLLVTGDGRHVGLVAADGSLSLLRDRAGDFIRDMWGDATAASLVATMSADRRARCGPDSCVAEIESGGRRWRVLATRSKALIARDLFAPACRDADIVVSERRLPNWCRPRWLKLDRAALGKSGAMALWLAPLKIRSVAREQGDHPWAAQGLSNGGAGPRACPARGHATARSAAGHRRCWPDRAGPLRPHGADI